MRAFVKKYGPAVAVAASMPLVALAQGSGSTEPDPTTGIAEISGAAAVIVLIANSKYVIQGLKWAAAKIGAMFGR